MFPVDYEIIKGSTSPTGVSISVVPNETLKTLTLTSNAASAADLDNVFALANSKIDQTTADGRYVNVTGDTMSGQLIVPSVAGPTGDVLKLVADGTTKLWVTPTELTATVPVGLPADPTTVLQAATKQYVDTQVATKAPLRQTISTIASTSSTPALSDENKLLYFTASTAVTITVPPNSSTAFPVGARIDLIQAGAGKVTAAPGAGVTLNGTPSLGLRSQWSAATIIKVATDTWVIVGDLA